MLLNTLGEDIPSISIDQSRSSSSLVTMFTVAPIPAFLDHLAALSRIPLKPLKLDASHLKNQDRVQMDWHLSCIVSTLEATE